MSDVSERWNQVWKRVRNGRHTLVVGASSTPVCPSDLKLLEVDCSPPWTTRGPLLEACRIIEQLLGDQDSDVAAGLADEGGLWERAPLSNTETVFVQACNRILKWGGGHCAVVFRAVDQADEVTLESLTEVLGDRDRLKLPLVLCTSVRSSARVVELAALLGLEAEIVEVPTTADLAASRSGFQWESLAPEVLRVMRAAAVMGQTFEARLLARLLDDSLGSILHSLQRAADAGAPIADRGEGTFSLPPEALGGLQSKILPSLLTYLNERVGELLSETAAMASAPRVSSAEPAAPAAPHAPSRSSRAAGNASLSSAPDDKGTERLAKAFESRAGTAAGEPSETKPTVPATEPVVVKVAADAAPETRDVADGEPDRARAAAHLRAAGKTEEAVRQYLAAVRELSTRGDIKRALMLNDQALEILDGLHESAQRDLLRSEVLLERARLQWQGSGLGPPFLLQDALATVEQACASLPERAPMGLQGDLAGLKAAICYDLGDVRSLETALTTLTTASRQLLAAGDATRAARLLNDQAAIYLRQGDPVRATHLLSQSRALFSKLLTREPESSLLLMELAETEHLLARLALHARVRPERRDEAFDLSLQYGRRAERVYQQLGRQRELSRVWETMGRLELARGQHDTAWQLFSAALETQRELGDATGLARSTAALADLYVSAGRLGEGIQLLADSVDLNHRKGSPIGLAFNRRTVDKLTRQLASGAIAGDVGDREALQVAAEMLEAAEAALGRMNLPDEPRRVPVSG